MTGCEPPRCAKAKERCQCPNSWVEYLSREARTRKEKGLSKLSVKRHAINYKEVKREGRFKTDRTTRECGDTDTQTLCAWNHERGSPRKHAARIPTSYEERFLKLTDNSIKPLPGQPRIRTGILNGIPVIIKIEEIRDKGEGIDFKYVTKMHSFMSQHIPNSVPKLFKAYFLRSKSGLKGVHIMERLEGVEMDKYLQTGQRDWPSLAGALKRLLDDFATCKVLHSDIQPHNVMLSLDRRGRVKEAKAFDFEGTYLVKTVPTDNTYLLLGDCFGEDAIIPAGLIREMLKIYPSLSRDVTSPDFLIDSEQSKTPRVRDLEGLPLLQVIDSDN